MLEGAGIKEHKPYFADVSGLLQRFGSAAHGDSSGVLDRIPISSGRDRGEGDGAELQLIRNPDGFAMATGQRLGFAVFASTPERTHSVDYMFCSKPASRSGHSLSGRKPADARNNFPAGIQNRRATGAMDGAVHTSSPKQRGVRRVHNGIGVLASNIAGTGDDKNTFVQRNSHNFAGVGHQTE